MAIELESKESGQPIPLEAGVYPAVVESVEPEPGGQFGDQVKLYLRTQEMGEDGEPVILWAWASQKLTTASKLYGWVTAVTGTPPEVGKTFNVDELLTGRACRVQLSEETLKDGTTRKRVSDVLAAKKQAAPPADTCSKCLEPVAFYTETGVALCEGHAKAAA